MSFLVVSSEPRFVPWWMWTLFVDLVQALNDEDKGVVFGDSMQTSYTSEGRIS